MDENSSLPVIWRVDVETEMSRIEEVPGLRRYARPDRTVTPTGRLAEQLAAREAAGYRNDSRAALNKYPAHKTRTTMILMPGSFFAGGLLAAGGAALGWVSVQWPVALILFAFVLGAIIVPFLDDTDPLEVNPGDIDLLTSPWPQLSKDDPEAAVVAVAERIATDIRSSSAWSDDALSEHRVRLDLDEELEQIAWSCHDLAAARKAMPEPPVNDSTDEYARVQRLWADRHTAHQEHQDALIDRVAALHGYRQSLAPIEALLHNLATARSLAADDAVAFTHAAADAAAAHNSRALADEIAAIEAGIIARVEFLHTAISAPTVPLAIEHHA